MAISARDFMSQNPPRRHAPQEFQGKRTSSAMAPYAIAISDMRAQGYTLAQVQEFLKKNGVPVSIAAISMFLSSLKKTDASKASAVG